MERIYSAHEAHEAALPLLGELHARLKQVEIVERFAALPVPEQQRAIARCREVHGWVASTASARVGLPEDAAVVSERLPGPAPSPLSLTSVVDNPLFPGLGRHLSQSNLPA